MGRIPAGAHGADGKSGGPRSRTAGLARAICPVDPSAASGLYRDAIASLFNLPDRAFAERGTTVLPVGSFSGRWNSVVPAALKCDPGLAAMAETQRARERMIRRNARGPTQPLRRARELLNDKTMLDRAAQVAGAAIEAGDPDTLDFSLLASVLSGLNGGAPDLSDDLFARSLDFVMSEQAPSPDSLQSLAKFLFGGPKPGDKLDEDQSGGTYTISGATVENLTGTRPAANPDNIEAPDRYHAQAVGRPRRRQSQPGGCLCAGLPVAAAGEGSDAGPRARSGEGRGRTASRGPGRGGASGGQAWRGGEPRPRQRGSRRAAGFPDPADSQRDFRRPVRSRARPPAQRLGYAGPRAAQVADRFFRGGGSRSSSAAIKPRVWRTSCGRGSNAPCSTSR